MFQVTVKGTVNPAFDDIMLYDGACGAYEGSCDFENGMCIWSNQFVSKNFWYIQKSTDHTLTNANGKYRVHYVNEML